MKQVLLNMLQMQETQITFLGQIAADISALKNVVRILDARAEPLLEKEMALERDRFQLIVEAYRREIQTLRQLISEPANPKPN